MLPSRTIQQSGKAALLSVAKRPERIFELPVRWLTHTNFQAQNSAGETPKSILAAYFTRNTTPRDLQLQAELTEYIALAQLAENDPMKALRSCLGNLPLNDWMIGIEFRDSSLELKAAPSDPEKVKILEGRAIAFLGILPLNRELKKISRGQEKLMKACVLMILARHGIQASKALQAFAR